MRNRASNERRRSIAPAAALPVVLATLALAGCGGGSGARGSGSNASSKSCAYVAKLDDIAAAVGRADVRDPDAFKRTLTGAVHDYTANLEALRAVAPSELRDSIQRVQSDVEQFRFDAAAGDRAQLDAYAARVCGRVVAATTPSTTTAPTGATTTVAPISSTGG